MKIITTKKYQAAFFLVVLIAIALRLYKLGEIPPSISWDEAAVGYNAYTIANWGKDEWGQTFPLYFKSFEDDKSPVHIYFTALSVKLFGLSDFTTRLPSAVFGVLNVILIFYLAKILFDNRLIALSAAFFLAVSPYSIQFSRFNHEANFALFFFMLGLYLFIKAVNQKPKLLIFSFISFAVSIFSYHSPKLVVPVFVLSLLLLYLKKLINMKRYFITSLVVPLILLVLVILVPGLTGASRMKQTLISQDEISKSYLYQKTQSSILGQVDVVWFRYRQHFTREYLFETGDKNSKFSIQTIGQFFWVDVVLVAAGLIWLILRRSKSSVLVLLWLFLAPLPASIFGGKDEVPHAARALFMMGSWQIIAAAGLFMLTSMFKHKVFQFVVAALVVLAITIQFKGYLYDYYQVYGKKEAINWQYGMKDIVEYVKDHNGYFQVFTTDIRFQPYIFYLYYLKTPLPDYIRTAVLNSDVEKRKYSLVAFYGNYHFGDWDPVESMPNAGVLYVVTPSQYDGMRDRDVFSVKKIIKYPDGGNAYYLVSYP